MQTITTIEDAVDTLTDALRYHVRQHVFGKEYGIEPEDAVTAEGHRGRAIQLRDALVYLIGRNQAFEAIAWAYHLAERDAGY